MKSILNNIISCYLFSNNFLNKTIINISSGIKKAKKIKKAISRVTEKNLFVKGSV